MDSICQAKLKSGHLLHKMVLVQSQRNRTVYIIKLTSLFPSIGSKITLQDIRWVITVPAIWRQKAKQFMREAAYEAGIGGM